MHQRMESPMTFKKRTQIAYHWFIWVLHLIVDTIVNYIFRIVIFKNSGKKLMTPIKHAFLLDSASTLARKIRLKQLTSEELVLSCIQRIEEVNIHLNCIVDRRFDLALMEAKKVDELIAEGKVPVDKLKIDKPFLGVPFTSKESTHAKGMNITFGIVARRGCKATEDAEIIRLVKEGGGILLAVTNVPELNLWQETRNNIYGQTNNPYNLKKTVGGSSGGEAAAIAACASPFGLGTDIGGSIRMPSYFCGIYGHKPTTGLISTKGLTYRSGDEQRTMVAAGPMTRYAEDIIPLLKLMLGEKSSTLKLDEEVNLSNIRLCYVTEPGDLRVSAVSKEVKLTIQRAVIHLENKCKGPAQQLNIPGFSHSYALWRYWMSKEPGNFAYDLGNRQHRVSAFPEVYKMLMGNSEYTLPPILKLIESKVFPPVPAKWAEEETRQLHLDLLDIMGNDSVLLFPSHPTTADFHYVPFFRPYNFAYWAVVNVLHYPCTQVPLGLSSEGLPLGIQVVSTPFNDHLCIAVAQELENAFGGFVSPCPIKVPS